MKQLKTKKSYTFFLSELFAGEKKSSKLSFQMILGIDQGIGGSVLDMEKKMVWVPRLEIAENNEFLKSVNFFLTF